MVQVLDFKSQSIAGKRVLIREDLNVPIKNGKVSSDARIRAAWPTIEYAIDQGARVMVCSHLGRPEEGVAIADQREFSMAPVAQYIENMSGKRVQLVEDYLDGFEWGDADFVMFENVRVNAGESKNDESLAKRLAALCDIFVMDAFGTAHRAQATTEGVARFAPVACAGPLLMDELSALQKALSNPARPVVAIVGGSKVSTKLDVLDALSGKVDTLVVGGGIANTFLAANGNPVGRSLYEPDLIETAKRLLGQVEIPVPIDVVVGKSLEDEKGVVRDASDVRDDEMILDVGPKTAEKMCEIMKSAATIIWNGPVGVFENDAFGEGTRALSAAIAESDAFSLAGGGDTLAAIEKYGIAEKVSYISTGGGAFLEFVEGKILPAVAVLEARAVEQV